MLRRLQNWLPFTAGWSPRGVMLTIIAKKISTYEKTFIQNMHTFWLTLKEKEDEVEWWHEQIEFAKYKMIPTMGYHILTGIPRYSEAQAVYRYNEFSKHEFMKV